MKFFESNIWDTNLISNLQLKNHIRYESKDISSTVSIGETLAKANKKWLINYWQ